MAAIPDMQIAVSPEAVEYLKRLEELVAELKDVPIPRIERLDLKPGDTLAITYEGMMLRSEEVSRIRNMIIERFPGIEAVVLCGPAKLAVISGSPQ